MFRNMRIGISRVLPLRMCASSKVENGDQDIRHHAEEWIETNCDQIDHWLAAARESAQ